jgi:hypothetical protein
MTTLFVVPTRQGTYAGGIDSETVFLNFEEAQESLPAVQSQNLSDNIRYQRDFSINRKKTFYVN